LEHTRIDEGVKRGPKRKYAKRLTARPLSRDPISGRISPSIPDDLDPADVLARYLGDERTADIAASLGVTRPALNMWLLDRAEEPWRKAQVALAVSKKEKAEDELGGAADPLTLARAREQLRSAQWELERIFSRIYGQKQEVTHEIGENLASVLRGISERKRERLIGAAHQSTATIEDALIRTTGENVESST